MPFLRLNLSFGLPSLHKKIMAGLSLVSAISLGLIWVSYRTTMEQVELRNQMTHTYQILNSLKAIVSDLRDVETGQQAYMLYGQETFLKPYYVGLKAVPQELRVLQHLTRDNLIQQQRLTTLGSLATRKIAIARMCVEARRSQGLEGAIRVGGFESGKQTMDSIYGLVGLMGKIERQFLQQRSQQAEANAQAALHLSLVSLGFNLAILVGVYNLITHKMMRHQQAEEKLQISEEQYRILTEVSQQVVWMGLPDGSIIYCNQLWFNYTGLTMEQTASGGWVSVIHPEDRERVREIWKRAIAQDKGYEVEIRLRRASDGAYRWHLGRVLPRRDETEAIVQWVGICTDIHDQKETEMQLRTLQRELEVRVQERTQELARVNQLLQSILDNVGDGVIVADKAGEFLFFNPAAAQILDAGSTTKAPDKWSQEYGLYLPDTTTPYPAEELPLARAIQGVSADDIEVFSRPQTKPAGVWLSASARPLRNERGEVTGGIAVFHDTTERKRAEENLRAYAAKLEKVNQELEQFNYIAAHDLKTPLRTIATRIEILLKQLGPLSTDTQHHMNRISLAARRIDRLLSDLLSYSQISAQEKPLAATDSKVTLQQVLDHFLNYIHESSAIIEVESWLPTVLADPDQLTQVFYHLISNSLKFCRVTPQIKISATYSPTECTFCVADNGIGIPAGSEQRIFGVFKRLHSQEVYEGTGIGLAIVKRILDWHGSRIWVESEVGKGSKFFFTLQRASKKLPSPPEFEQEDED